MHFGLYPLDVTFRYRGKAAMSTVGRWAEVGRRLAMTLPAKVRRIPVEASVAIPSIYSR